MKRDFTPILFTFALLAFLGYFFHAKKPTYSPDSPNTFSSYNAHPAGYKGIYEVINHYRTDVSRWDSPFNQLPDEAGVIIIPHLLLPLLAKEEVALKEWQDRGGNVIHLNKSETSVNNYALSHHPQNSVAIVQQVVELKGPIYFDEYHNSNHTHSEFAVALQRLMESRYRWVSFHLLAAALLFYFVQSRGSQDKVEDEHQKMNGGIVQTRGALFEYARATTLCERAINSFKNRRFHP